jgi:hypothetical protein
MMVLTVPLRRRWPGDMYAISGGAIDESSERLGFESAIETALSWNGAGFDHRALWLGL